MKKSFLIKVSVLHSVLKTDFIPHSNALSLLGVCLLGHNDLLHTEQVLQVLCISNRIEFNAQRYNIKIKVTRLNKGWDIYIL